MKPVNGPKPRKPSFSIGDVLVGQGAPLLLISGPCVIEDASQTKEIAAALKEMAATRGIGFVFKASFDKANRTSVDSYRGPGLGLAVMRGMGFPVVFDATHSVQMPGGQGSCSSGDRDLAPVLARAAVAAGVDGVFFEVHPNPDHALCDGPNSLRLKDVPRILDELLAIRAAISKGGP